MCPPPAVYTAVHHLSVAVLYLVVLVMATQRFFVDEAGDGVLFGPQGRSRLNDPDAMRFFMLGKVSIANEALVADSLSDLRTRLLANPLYSSIHSLRPAVNKTAVFFHAKDDHPEIRSKVFELLIDMDFKFYAVIKDMFRVLEYVRHRGQRDSLYRYHPNELYDFSVRQLFRQRLHRCPHSEVVFARRGKADRTDALRQQLLDVAAKSDDGGDTDHDRHIDVRPADPRTDPCLQVTDYCLWALQRCYEKCETRFIEALWPKVSLIRDLDDDRVNSYGAYLTRKSLPPTESAIKNRRI